MNSGALLAGEADVSDDLGGLAPTFGNVLNSIGVGVVTSQEALDQERVGFERVGAEDIILVNGKYGLFTPLTNADDAESAQNLEEIVEVLRAELKKAQTDKADLQRKLIEATQKPTRTPDDFVTAIQHSVDSLQGKLAEMKNPVSDFVVSELTIDTRVFVDVNALGAIDYRFVQPGDNVDANLLSRLTLKIQPVPKQSQAGVYDMANFTPFADVDEIQGVGAAYKEKLRTKNIYTVADLLHAGTRVRSRVELASMLDVDHRRLGEWLSHAELMTVKTIEGHNAEVLFDLGIDSLEALATQDGAGLLERYNQRVKEKGHRSYAPADQKLVDGWIAAAKLYVGKKA